MYCGFSLFLHFHISFPSVILDFKLLAIIYLIRGFQVKISTSSLFRKLRNLEVPTCYLKDFSREFWSNLADFQNNLFRANFKKPFEFNKMY